MHEMFTIDGTLLGSFAKLDKILHPGNKCLFDLTADFATFITYFCFRYQDRVIEFGRIWAYEHKPRQSCWKSVPDEVQA